MDVNDFLTDFTSVFLTNAILSVDNAIVLAYLLFACQKKHDLKALSVGVFASFFVRTMLMAFAGEILHHPAAKVIAGLTLCVIAFRSYQEFNGQKGQNASSDDEPVPDIGETGSFFKDASAFFMADLSMSWDNILAVASVAPGNSTAIIAGTAISGVIVVLLSKKIKPILHKFHFLKIACVILLAGIALRLLFQSLRF